VIFGVGRGRGKRGMGRWGVGNRKEGILNFELVTVSCLLPNDK
jgi:hypothetical protein